MGFSRQEYWSGLPLPSPGDLPDPGIKPRFSAFQADALTSEPPEQQEFRKKWRSSRYVIVFIIKLSFSLWFQICSLNTLGVSGRRHRKTFQVLFPYVIPDWERVELWSHYLIEMGLEVRTEGVWWLKDSGTSKCKVQIQSQSGSVMLLTVRSLVLRRKVVHWWTLPSWAVQISSSVCEF